MPASVKYFVSADGTDMPKWYKDPDDVLDYTLDFRHKLAADDYIIGVSFRANSALTIISSNVTDSVDFDDTTREPIPVAGRENCAVSVWISNGLLGRIYDVVCRAVTLEGRQMERTFQLIIGTN